MQAIAYSHASHHTKPEATKPSKQRSKPRSTIKPGASCQPRRSSQALRANLGAQARRFAPNPTSNGH